ncbi:MAG TPA: hypothetical protein VN682_02195 [Terriglobales bacterium]|nr:hypothetical protein [Terriglobales bacterium]
MTSAEFILSDASVIAVRVGHAISHALSIAFVMFWDILWGLILGFLLSAIVEAIVSKGEIVRLLPDDRPKTTAKACALGAASYGWSVRRTRFT